MLVELSCSTTLTPAYNDKLFHAVIEPKGQRKTVVFIVCGGFKIGLDSIAEYRQATAADVEEGGKGWKVLVDGEEVSIDK